MTNEADTCRIYVLPKLHAAGWNDDQICKQRCFTDGRIVTVDRQHYRKPGKKVDYMLRYRPHFPLAVIEAKAAYRRAGDGLRQALGMRNVSDRSLPAPQTASRSSLKGLQADTATALGSLNPGHNVLILGNGSFHQLVVVPEPSTLLLLMAGAAAIHYYRQRRRR